MTAPASSSLSDTYSLTSLIERVFSQASNSSTSSTSSTDILLSQIREAQAQAQSLSLISSNDTIDDLPTSSLRAVLLESLYAQALLRVQTRPGDFIARKDLLCQSLVSFFFATFSWFALHLTMFPVLLFQTTYKKYLSSLLSLRILDISSTSSYQSMLAKQCRSALSKDVSPLPADAVNRRSTKITALKLERALKSALDEYRQAARAKVKKSSGVVSSTGLGWTSDTNGGGPSASTSASPRAAVGDDEVETEYDVLVLPKRQAGFEDEDDEDTDADETFVGESQGREMDVHTPSTLRSYLLTLCQLHALLSINAIDSIYSELSILASMPSNAESIARERAGQEKDEMNRRQSQGQTEEWRLDQRWGSSNTAPLLDRKGKPQRPFTILPSGSKAMNGQGSMGASAVQTSMDARQNLREQVFQPSHRLPTMSIDEYLEEEQRRGNIISGGGQASAEAPTSSELLALRSQGYNVGTREAEEANEEQRRKANDWDEFEENNPKGMGNTMNRG